MTTATHLHEFIWGMDLSMLKYAEDHGVQYSDSGVFKDPLTIFQNHGTNYVRLRLFVNPNGRDGQVNTLAYTLELAQRVKRAGLPILLDFHYSDEWADPGRQTIPADWQGLSHPELMDRVFAYTREVMLAFDLAGCLPNMVAVGNEITNGMMWPAAGPFSSNVSSTQEFDAMADFLKAGIRAVRACDPEKSIQIMLHIDQGGNKEVCRFFFDGVRARDIEFDVIGLSYYPFWHGTLSDLAINLASLWDLYEKDIIVVETGHDWTGLEPECLSFPHTTDGQLDFLMALIHTVSASPGGKGIFYWAPEWIMGEHWQAPTWSNVWENRAMFDRKGNALPSIHAFEASRTWK